MKNVLVKITSSILLMIILITTVFAIVGDCISRDDINSIYNGDIEDSTAEARGRTEKIIGAVLDALRIAGAAIAIIILLVIASKYIVASAGDRADIKRYAVNYVIGAIVFFAASGILTIIRKTILNAFDED